MTKNTSEYVRLRCSTESTQYEALQINVSASGYYRFSSNSSMDTYGFLYRDTFDPFAPVRNQIARDDDSCGNGQFRLDHFLQKKRAYILVATVFGVADGDPFTITALSDSDRVNFTRLREYYDL